MKNEINVRQICIIMLCFGAASKLMLYPTVAATACGNSLWLPALVNLALQTAVVWAVSFLCSRTDKTFFELLSHTFGTVVARIVFFLFALFFVVNAVVPVSEQQLLVHSAFYDTIPSIIVFLPFFVFSLYAGTKRFTNVGRTADVCLPVFIVTVLLLLAMALAGARFVNLLPILKQPLSKLAGGTLSSAFRFNESTFMLMFMGHFRYKKGDGAKITLSYAVGGLIVVLFMLVFYAVYGELAQTQPFAITKISIGFASTDTFGRLDLLAVYALDIVMLFALVLNVQMSAYCLSKAFNRDNRPVYSLVINAVLLALTIVFNFEFQALQAIGAKWLWIPTLIFAYALPLLAWTCRRKNEKN